METVQGEVPTYGVKDTLVVNGIRVRFKIELRQLINVIRPLTIYNPKSKCSVTHQTRSPATMWTYDARKQEAK